MKKISEFAKRYIWALACAIYMFTIGVASARGRHAVRWVAHWFGYPEPGETTELPLVAPDEISDPATAVELFEPAGVDGNVPLLQLLVMARLVRTERPSGIFEIGTFDGRTTLNLAANAEPSTRVITLDLPAADVDETALAIEEGDRAYVEKPVSGSRFLGTDFEARITQVFGDSATFDYSPYKGKIDFVFVDGAHSYEYVKNDTDRALELLGDSGGWILWDDYGVWDGVTTALNEYYRSGGVFGGLKHVEGTPLAVLKVEPKI